MLSPGVLTARIEGGRACGPTRIENSLPDAAMAPRGGGPRLLGLDVDEIRIVAMGRYAAAQTVGEGRHAKGRFAPDFVSKTMLPWRRMVGAVGFEPTTR